jgi:hypothetical protein
VKPSADVDALFAALLAAGESLPRVVQALAAAPDEEVVVSVLRRAVPVRALEHLARTPPWSESSRVLAAIVLNPKSPPRLSLAVVPTLAWRSLADVAASPRVPSAVRLRAESVLKERLPEMRLGEKITLGRLATAAVLLSLLVDTDARILESCLENPRLREADLAALLRRPEVAPVLIEAAAASTRWTRSYLVRLEIAVQPRTPLGIALAQLSSLNRADLIRVSRTPGLRALVQAAALRVAGERTQ